MATSPKNGNCITAPLFWVGVFLCIRLLSLGFPNLLVEEAYYWQYAAHLAPGYLDHPPAVAVLIHLGTTLFGHNEFGVRIGAFLCWGIAGLFIFKLTAQIFDRRAARGALAIFASLPFFFGSTWMMTPDAPLVACWAAGLYFLYQALVARRLSAWWLVGVAMGFGMLSKYTMALLGAATGVYMLIEPAARRQFFTLRPYLAALFAAIIFSPVIYWNITNDWASFAFQGSRRLEEKSEFYLPMLLLDILIILTPVGVAAVWRGFKGAGFPFKDGQSKRFLAVMTFLPVLVFLLFSLSRETRINWTGPAFLGAIPVLGYSLAESATLPRLFRAGWRITLPALAILYAIALTYIGFAIPGVPYAKKLHKFVEWDDLAAQLNSIAREVKNTTGESPLIIGMDKHYMASELAFYTKKLTLADPNALPLQVGGRNIFGQPSLMYSFWSPPAIAEGRTLILISRTRSDLEFSEIVAQTGHQEPIMELTKRRNGKSVGTYFYRIVSNYRRP